MTQTLTIAAAPCTSTVCVQMKKKDAANDDKPRPGNHSEFSNPWEILLQRAKSAEC
jgi:hypothetical protein